MSTAAPKVTVSARIKKESEEYLSALAKKQDRSVSYHVAKAVEEYVERLRKEEAR